jgi:outer membrane biosynthesis protein TonB
LQNEGDFEENEVVVLLETPTPTPEETPTPTPTPEETPTPTPEETPTPTPEETPTPTPEETPTPTPTPEETPTPTPEETPTPTPQETNTTHLDVIIKKEDDNVVSTPMYDVVEDITTPENMGPYYVPWKKSTMDYYNKIKNTQVNSGYLNGSTLGNVGLNNEKK